MSPAARHDVAYNRYAENYREQVQRHEREFAPRTASV